MHTPSRILVPVDFTESSRAALEYAALLGSRLGAEVDMFHVWRSQHAAASKGEVLTEFMQSDAGHEMTEWLASFEKRGDVIAHGRLAEGAHGQVPDAIVEAVESCAYDLVVMATHGRQGLSHLLRGSVTEKVVRRAPCPVITVRSPDDDLPSTPESADVEVVNAWFWPPV
jgi:universal stress protein A